MSSDPIRAALERLVELEAIYAAQGADVNMSDWDAAIAAARAALEAELEGEGPSIEEFQDLCEEHCFNVEGYESIERLLGLINDAIFRWGRPATPPAPVEGDVGELVAELRHFVVEYQKMRGLHPESIYSIQEGIEGREAHLRVSQLTCAAALLEQLSAPAPACVGADQELDACCEWVSQWCGRWPDGTRPEDELRTARRPKPSSLKEQALAKTTAILDDPGRVLLTEVRETLELTRRALEAQP